MSRSRNTLKGHKNQGCPAGRKCSYCADNRQFNTKQRLASDAIGSRNHIRRSYADMVDWMNTNE